MSIQLILTNQRVERRSRHRGLGDAMRAFLAVVFIYAMTAYVYFEAGRAFERTAAISLAKTWGINR